MDLKLLLLVAILHKSLFVGCGKFKVVDAPFSFNSPLGSRGGGGGGSQGNTRKVLMTRVDPQPPSGPPYLIEKLNGKCFEQMANNYKYEFCPFQNVTQREQTYRWNAFQGVLGVWKHWLIENGTFTAMHMTHGEICVGTLDRQVQVKLKCGDSNKIVSVSEPETCRYVMIFKTPYACPDDVFDVYPILTDHGKKMWENINIDFMMEIITKKGYEKRMKKLYEAERIYVSIDNKNTARVVSDSPITPDSRASKTENSFIDFANGFLSKHQCVQEYLKLSQEVIKLRFRLKNLKDANSLLDIHATQQEQLAINTSKSTIESKNKIGKYKRGELGDKRATNDSSDSVRRLVGRRKSDEELQNIKDNSLSSPADHLRGDTGTVEEMENPDRQLRDRLHENGVPDHEIVNLTEVIKGKYTA